MPQIDVLKSLIFYGFAFLILGFAFISIFSMRIIYSLIASVIVFFASAGIYFLLGADYNAAIQILIYGIAIPIVFALAIMFTADKLDKKTFLTLSPRLYLSFLACGILFLALIYLLIISLSLDSNSQWILAKQTMSVNKYQMFAALTEGIYKKYVYAFELFSLLLVICVVGFSTFEISKEKTDG